MDKKIDGLLAITWFIFGLVIVGTDTEVSDKFIALLLTVVLSKLYYISFNIK